MPLFDMHKKLVAPWSAEKKFHKGTLILVEAQLNVNNFPPFGVTPGRCVRFIIFEYFSLALLIIYIRPTKSSHQRFWHSLRLRNHSFPQSRHSHILFLKFYITPMSQTLSTPVKARAPLRKKSAGMKVRRGPHKSPKLLVLSPPAPEKNDPRGGSNIRSSFQKMWKDPIRYGFTDGFRVLLSYFFVQM
jgi:hypothetical protein